MPGMDRKAILVGLFALILGCGEEEKEDPLTREGFCSAWGAAACSAETVDACQAASADACKATQRETCLDLVSEDFVDNDAETCINGVQLAYLDADLTSSEIKLVQRLAGACNKILSGPGEEGDDCAQNSDCNRVQDLRCVIKGAATMGTCQVPEVIEAGRECTDPEDVCEDGFFCSMDVQDDMANCLAQRDEDSPCASAEECDDDTFCNADGVCEARRGVDTACTANEQCQSDVCYEFADGPVCIDGLRLSRSESICETLR